ncbi:MAG TPA: FkbM family methyltransferase [Pyrinomonadaceae bacterium]
MIAQKIEITWLNLIRLYTFYFPVNKGKWRASAFARKLCRHLPEKILATTKDGRKLYVALSDWAGESIFFLGKHEQFSAEIFARHIKRGFVCLDVGANIGWHTTLMSRLSGAEGEVHAFEPVPPTFEDLKKNVSLNGEGAEVFLNNFGLGGEESTAEIHLFNNLPSGHATLAGKDNEPSTVFPIKIKTLDAYLEEKNIKRVDFIKVDIEGAEMMFLKGSQKVFDQENAPVIYMEMTLETSAEFGYLPDDLIVFLKNKARYKFFRIDEAGEKLVEIEGFAPDDGGANVLCLPQNSN